ncbi:TolC family protein, partial [bacterium]|nr:TolC family protein [bacterium]
PVDGTQGPPEGSVFLAGLPRARREGRTGREGQLTGGAATTTTASADPLVTALLPLKPAPTDADADADADATTRAAAAIDSLVAQALRRAPALAAAAADIATLSEQVPAAGALPDPMVMLGATGENYPGAGLGRDPMAMASLEVTQAIPWPGKRSLRTAAAAAMVPAGEARLEMERRALAADVRELWAGLFATDVALGSLRRVLALFDVLEPQALARYETGAGAQADWLALRRERLGLESAVETERARREGLLARLGAALADTTAAAQARPDLLPPIAAAPPTDGAGFAAVAMAEAEATAAGAEAAAARRESRPDLLVGAEYGWRDALAPMLTARVGLELPLWKGRKQEALARAAAARRTSATLTAAAARLEADAEVRELAARQRAAASAAARLRDRVVPLLELAAESARARYLAAGADATALVVARKDLAEARTELAREEAEAWAAAARLLALSGRDPVAGDGRRDR